MKKAWIENGIVRDVCPVGLDPVFIYGAEIGAHYTEDVPDDAEHGWVQMGGVWQVPPPPPPAPPAPKTRDQLKAERQAAVDAIKVTTHSGRVFDGDETSQTRMARAIVGMQAAQAALGANAPTTITWVLADNTAADVTAQELAEALILAGQAQADIWVLPYEEAQQPGAPA